jgi:3-oxoacyl-[acyl-carrier protein] reductase
MANFDLEGRVALVTGASAGLGRHFAQVLAEAGAAVVLAARRRERLDEGVREIAARGGRAVAVLCDVADAASVRAAVDAAEAALGPIDILVNNAGIAGINKTVWETDFDEWRKVLRINLDGPFICCKAIVPQMLRQKYGRIVNIASIAGKEGNPNAAHYSASKAGLIALTKSLGKELASHDILVNAVTPAAAKTAIFDQMTQTHIDFMLSKIPKARFVLVEEVAAMVAWLASADCAFSTGAVFDISGGRATY